MDSTFHISEYLIRYYNITKDTSFQVSEIEGYQLLNVNRFDLGAKLYYIRSKMEGTNLKLARQIYCKHIEAFQDGIVEETGKRDKQGIGSYYAAFDSLIDSFQRMEYEKDREWIPVDGNNQIMDGAHRLACSIYFKKKLKIICFPHIKCFKFDFKFFRNRGLEQECMRIMAAEFSSYCDITMKQKLKDSILFQDISYRTVIPRKGYTIFFKHSKRNFIKNNTVQEQLCITEIEERQVIQSRGWEKKRCRYIRNIRNKYTRVLLLIKRIIKAPI